MILTTIQLNELFNYFLRYFTDETLFNTKKRLIDLGFESLDYLELGAFILKNLKQWLDISQINKETKICDLPFYLIDPPKIKCKSNHVKLLKIKQQFYKYQFQDPNSLDITFSTNYYGLKSDINLSLLEDKIRETLDNHYLLNTRLMKQLDDYYFIPTEQQESIYIKSSFFSKENKFIVTVHSHRLVNIYLYKKNKIAYLIIAFHHAVMDGWSRQVILEEIFRRYSGQHNTPPKDKALEIAALNNIYDISLTTRCNIQELKKLLNSIKNPKQFFEVDYLFYGPIEHNSDVVLITEQELEQYTGLNHFPYSTLVFLFIYTILNKISGHDKFAIHTSLSDRLLPIPEICDLIGDLTRGLPILLDKKEYNAYQFAHEINETLRIYFQHMPHSVTDRILLDGDTFLNRYLSPFHQPYYLLLTYINDISKTLYKSPSIINKYIDWPNSRGFVSQQSKNIFFVVEHYDNNLVLYIHTSAARGVHTKIMNYISNLKDQFKDSKNR